MQTFGENIALNPKHTMHTMSLSIPQPGNALFEPGTLQKSTTLRASGTARQQRPATEEME